MAINVNGFDGMVNAHTRFSKGGNGKLPARNAAERQDDTDLKRKRGHGSTATCSSYILAMFIAAV